MSNRVGVACKHHRWDIAGYLAVVMAIIWLTVEGAKNQGYHWQWFRIPPYLVAADQGQFLAGPILRGLGVTLNITWISLILSFAIGLVTALLRLSHSLVGRAIARVYLETARNTPLLVQLFFIYFIIAPVLGIGRFTAAVLALSLFEGAYASEIYRAGIVSIHRGQWEAAYSLGLGTWHSYRFVILPQAIRRVLPPLTGQAVSLIKDSSLVSVLAIYEMTMAANAIASQTFLVFEIYLTIAAIYLALTLALSRMVARMERKLKLEH